MAPVSEYVAIFCPNCGVHLNEVDEQDAPDTPRVGVFGSVYTCGWCSTRTADWSHVARCRRTAKARAALSELQEHQRRLAVSASLRRMIVELQDPIGAQ